MPSWKDRPKQRAVRSLRAKHRRTLPRPPSYRESPQPKHVFERTPKFPPRQNAIKLGSVVQWDASPGVRMWSACFWLYRREWTHSKELPLHLPIPASSPPCLLPRLLLQERKPRGNCRLESFGTPGLTEREGLPKRDSATPFQAHSQAIRLALDVSHPYETNIRRGTSIPHPRHWLSLAGLACVPSYE